jgi:predicted phage-related endonuclease
MSEIITREEWLEKRRNHLGASEVAAILGEDDKRGPLHVYASKVHGYSIEDNKVLKYGREMEAPIATIYADETGRPVRDPGSTLYQYHPDIKWLAATLDRETEGTEENPSPSTGTGALEIKNIDIPGLRPEEWNADNEEIFPFVIQNQIQMACAGFEWGSVTGKFPYYNLCWFDQLKDEEFLEATYPVLEEFWDRVLRKDPPPADSLPGTLDVCKRMWKNETGETVSLDADWLAMADEWEQAKSEARKADKTAKSLEAKLRAEMKDNTFGLLVDGTILTLKTTHKKGHVVKPSTHRTLRRSRPKGK